MINKKDYEERIKLHTPSSSIVKDCFFAFIFGGFFCFLGEVISKIYMNFGISEKNSYVLVTVSLIFLSALLTFLGVFDKIARIAGAGTLVPVTGFANSIVSEAMDTRSEGFILGVGSKIFTVAGPVIFYGTLSGSLVGLIYYVIGLF